VQGRGGVLLARGSDRAQDDVVLAVAEEFAQVLPVKAAIGEAQQFEMRIDGGVESQRMTRRAKNCATLAANAAQREVRILHGNTVFGLCAPIDLDVQR